MRIWNECGTRLFQQSYRQLSADGWEVVEKDLKRISSFKVIEQRLYGDAGTDEHRRSAVDLWVDGDQRRFHGMRLATVSRQV
jgi:phosphoglucomutase